MMKTIPLTQGKVALVDDEDYEMLMRHKWNVSHHIQGSTEYWYAIRTQVPERKNTKMHRVIMNAPPGVEVDHIDGDGLNNQKSNLRLVTRSQNQHNRKIQRSKYGYKGVRRGNDGNFRAVLSVEGKRNYSRGYKTAIEAAREYNRMARKYMGEFARLNPID